MVSISPEIQATLNGISQVQLDELPFVVAKTITDLAKGSQEQIRKEMPTRFTIRSSWPLKGLRIEPAKKADFRRGQCEGAVKHLDHYMALHEEGGPKENLSHGQQKGSGKMTAIPHYKARDKMRTGSGRLKKTALRALKKNTDPDRRKGRKWGKRRRPKPFIITPEKGSKALVAVREGRERYPVKYLFVLSKHPHIEQRFDFEKTVQSYVERNVGKLMAQNMMAAEAQRLARLKT